MANKNTFRDNMISHCQAGPRKVLNNKYTPINSTITKKKKAGCFIVRRSEGVFKYITVTAIKTNVAEITCPINENRKRGLISKKDFNQIINQEKEIDIFC